MKLLILGVILMTSISSTFNVEPLTDSEKAELKTARAQLDAAQAYFDTVSSKIKEAHGQPKPSNLTTASCIQGQTTVELRGDYALITHQMWNVCSGGDILGK